MPKRICIVSTIGLIIIFSLWVGSIGCNSDSGESEGTIVDEPVSTDNQQDEEPQSETEDVTSEQEDAFNQLPDEIRDEFGERHELEQEDIENITAYGVFMFPDAELIPDKSFGQFFKEGTEIYRLQFGAMTSVLAVADWYSDNLESDARREQSDLAGGEVLAWFEYEPPDRSWSKNISITGVPAENRCMITVNLKRIVLPPEEEEGE